MSTACGPSESFFAFDHADNHAICTEGIVGRTVRRLELEIAQLSRELSDMPGVNGRTVQPAALCLAVDQALASQPLGMLPGRSHTNVRVAKES